jgi:hypothetical protein
MSFSIFFFEEQNRSPRKVDLLNFYSHEGSFAGFIKLCYIT